MFKYLSSLTVYHTQPIYNLNWIKRPRFYRQILQDEEITVVDVGARALSDDELHELHPLSAHINYLGFDADPEEVLRLNSSPSKYKSAQFIASFVGSDRQLVNFNLHKIAGDSSIYEVSDDYTRWFSRNDVDPVETTLTLQADSLDRLVSRDVDFIKLDTQGSEYEILHGAERCLSEALLVEVEVEFFQIYAGQKLAHDVMLKMNSLGFDLLYLNRVSLNSNGFQGSARGQLVFGDALFGVSRQRALALSPSKKKKYCALLINYGHVDFAFDIFSNSPELSDCDELAAYLQKASITPPAVLRMVKFLVDKVIFAMLHIRRTNGLRGDSDRSWPTR
jgi:FkbM family methyltransferase